MASSLMETIKKNMAAGVKTAPQTAGRDLRQAVLAKSGKQVSPGAAPRMSSIQEEAAGEQVAVAGAGQQVAGQMQATQLGAQEQTLQAEQKSQVAIMDQKELEQADAYTRQASSILNNLSRQEKELDTQQKLAGMEQAGFLMGLSNKRYVQDLQQTASLKRLEDNAVFTQELKKSALEEDLAVYKEDLQFQRLMDSRGREFEQQLKSMDMESKYKIFKDQLKAEQRRKIISGGTDMVTSVLGMGKSSPAPAGGAA